MHWIGLNSDLKHLLKHMFGGGGGGRRGKGGGEGGEGGRGGGEVICQK